MDRITALRQIVADRQYAKVEGVLVDAFTATAILACHDAGSANTQQIIATAPLVKVAELSLRLVR